VLIDPPVASYLADEDTAFLSKRYAASRSFPISDQSASVMPQHADPGFTETALRNGVHAAL